MNKLLKSFALLIFPFVALVPQQAKAFALGDIELRSALNQPLDARVELISLGDLDLHEIDVELASPEDFRRVGLERPFFLTELQFELTRQEGTPYLLISTDKPVKEPFLDFLIEVEWPNGRLLREYTLLLDPPVFLEEEPVPIQAPIQSAAQAPVPADTASRVPDASPQGGVTAPTAANGELRYGPVSRTDTLWSIAKRMRPDASVTVPQVMMALLKHNPEAFYHNNVNYLKAGYVLRLPGPEAAREIDAREAERQVQLQNRQWEEARRQRAGGALKRPAGQDGAAGDVPAGIPADADAGAQVAGTGRQPRLRLVVPEEMEAGATALEGVADKTAPGASTMAELNALRRELALALETSEISRQENLELRQRLAELEEQIAAMQRLLALRDDTLAALQSGLVTQGEAGQEAVEENSPQSPEMAAADTTEQAGAGDSGTGRVMGQAANPDAGEIAGVAGQEAVELAQAGGQVSPEPQPAGTSQEPEAPVGESIPVLGFVKEFAGEVLDDPVMTGAAGGVGVLALGLAWMAVRRRRAAQEEVTAAELKKVVLDKHERRDETAEVMSAAIQEAALGSVSETPEQAQAGISEDGDALGLNVFQPEEDEIDTLAEADVYLAYRRFDKAEELLKDAIAQEPHRHDYALKLLEVYAATENRDAFLVQAETIRDAAEKGVGFEWQEAWGKTKAMGRQLLPDHPLFGGDSEDRGAKSGGRATGAEEAQSGDVGEVEERSLAEESFAEALRETGAAAGEESETTFAFEYETKGLHDEPAVEDFGLDEGGAIADASGGQSQDAPDLQGLDFDLGELQEAERETGDGPSMLEGSGLEGESTVESAAGSTESGEAAGKPAASESAGAMTDLAGEEITAGENESADWEAGTQDSGPNLEMDLGEVAEQAAPAIGKGEANLGKDSTRDDAERQGSPEWHTLRENLADVHRGQEQGENDNELSLETDIDWLAELTDEKLDDIEVEGMADEPDLITGEDEVATKLDLARAYIDMGDHESARSILDEVLDEGNEAQKDEAQQLLKSVGGDS